MPMATTRWEYRIAEGRAELAELGLDGWELVQAAVVNGQETFYLKRPCPSIREEITSSQREQALRQAQGGSDR